MKKQTPKTKRLTEAKRKHLKTVKRRQLSEVKKSIGKYLNEALNKDLKDFGTDLKKFLEEKGLTVKLGQGSAQPLYEPISKNDKYAALQLSDDGLHVIVSDSKIDVLEDLIKKYGLSTLADMKKSGGWDEDPNKKTQSEGEIYLAQELKQGRKGKAFELVIRRFNPSDIMEKTNLKFHPLNEVKNSLKKSIRNYQRLNENEGEISVNINRKEDEVEVTYKGESYKSALGDELLFIHYFEDDEYHSENDAPEIFKYLKGKGGELEVDDKEATLTINMSNLKSK